MNKLKQLILLAVPSRLILICGMFLSFSLLFGVTNLQYFLISLLSIVFTDSASSVLNSYTDIETDKKNKKNRPLVNKTVSKKEAIFFFIILLTIGFILSLMISNLWIVFLLRIITEILYSYFKLKNIFTVNYILTSSGYCIYPLLVAIISQDIVLEYPANFEVYSIISLILILSILMSPLKDVPDYKGDRSQKIMSLTTIKNNENYLTNLIYIIIIIVMTFILFWLYQDSKIYLAGIITIFLLINFLYYIKIIQKKIEVTEKTITIPAMLLAIEISITFSLIYRWLNV
ncbi:MAG: UbiA prenyltransferase family protein [Candidatus Diapherotrites archaeon]